MSTTATKQSRKDREAERDARLELEREARAARYAEVSSSWVSCPEPGCTIFPFETQAECDEHVAAGEHTAPSERVREVGMERSWDAPSGTSGGHSSAPAEPLASEKQVAFLSTLLAELATLVDADGNVHTAAAFAAGLVGLTKRAASLAIEQAMESLDRERAKAPAAAEAPTARPARTNKYAARCEDCGASVPAEEGSLSKEGGRWVVRHVGGCTSTPAAPASSGEAPEGFHMLDGTVWKVQLNQAGSGCYAKRLTLPTADELAYDPEARGSWDYVSGGMRKLSPATLMSKDDAAAFGRLYGFCGCCGRRLTNEESIEAGIGPVCAGKW